MFNHGFSGFTFRNADETERFYRDVLGLDVTAAGMGILDIGLPGGAHVIAYPKGDAHEPASFTILNFNVDDIDEAVDTLVSKGVTFEHYEGMTGEKGISRGKSEGEGPDIAWFTDPSGNILSVLSD